MIEQATYESLPWRFLAGDLPPDHDPIAPLRQRFLPEVQDLWVPIWWWAPAADVLQWGHISLDGTTLHADASTSHAVREPRRLALAHPWRAEAEERFALGAQAEPVSLGDGLILADERAHRWGLAHVAQAPAVGEARAQEGDQAERPADEAKRRAREEHARRRNPRGPQPQPPPGHGPGSRTTAPIPSRAS